MVLRTVEVVDEGNHPPISTGAGSDDQHPIGCMLISPARGATTCAGLIRDLVGQGDDVHAGGATPRQ